VEQLQTAQTSGSLSLHAAHQQQLQKHVTRYVKEKKFGSMVVDLVISTADNK
jgi:hypothetical protein